MKAAWYERNGAAGDVLHVGEMEMRSGPGRSTRQDGHFGRQPVRREEPEGGR